MHYTIYAINLFASAEQAAIELWIRYESQRNYTEASSRDRRWPRNGIVIGLRQGKP